MTLRNDTPRPRLRDKAGGSALVAAIALLTIMIGMSLAGPWPTSTRRRSSPASQRNRESAFNIAEAAMNAQIFALSQNWPGTAGRGTWWPACPGTRRHRLPACTRSCRGYSREKTTNLTLPCSGRPRSVDNQPPYSEFFSDAVLSGGGHLRVGPRRGQAPGATGTPDGKVWVRAEATVARQDAHHGRARTSGGAAGGHHQTPSARGRQHSTSPTWARRSSSTTRAGAPPLEVRCGAHEQRHVRRASGRGHRARSRT